MEEEKSEKQKKLKREMKKNTYMYNWGKHMLPRGKHGKLLMGRYGAKVVEQRASN